MNTPERSQEQNLQRVFLSKFSIWMVASIVVIAFLTSLQARSADVFIDEGDVDFDTTPVGEPSKVEPAKTEPIATTAQAESSADRTPAQAGDPLSEGSSAAGSATDPSATAPGQDLGLDPMPATDPIADPIKSSPPVEKAKKSSKSKSNAKAKKASKKKVAEKKSKKAKKASKKAKKHKSTQASHSKKNKKRSVASVGDFKGGTYKVTRDDCKLQTKPGSKTFIGETSAERKLWVEKSSNPNYFKVRSRDGSPAYVKKNCFH